VLWLACWNIDICLLQPAAEVPHYAALLAAHYLMTSTEVVQTRLINGSNYAVSKISIGSVP